MFNLFMFEIKAHLKGIIGWSIGLIAFAGLYVSVYPQVAEEMASLADLQLYSAMGVELGNFEGYISSVVLGFLPLLLGVYALLLGTGTLAGEEDAGTLELIMAKPLTRTGIVSVKAAAIGVILGVILLVTAAGDGLLFAGVKAGMDLETGVTPAQLTRVVLSAWPVCMALGMIGLFFGALMPSRRPAAALTGVVLAAGYFGENLAGMTEKLEPMKPLFLFSYYDSSSNVFSEGVQAVDVFVLLAAAAVSYVLALVCFGARDVTTGSWVWKRGKIQV